jgi:integrase
MTETESTEIAVLRKQDLTNPNTYVNSDLPKYWERDYINGRLMNIRNPSHQMLLRFMWFTGCRITEAVSVSKNQIDFTNYTITLKWLKSRKYNYRNIPMHPILRDLLQMYTAPMKQEQLIFPITRQRAWQLVKKYMEGHPHQFRHSFAVNWLRNGQSITTLCQMLGHADIKVTMQYLKIVPIDLGKELIKVQF